MTLSTKPKILLINPSSNFLMNEKMMPSLGLLKIGAYLEQECYFVKIMDLAGISDWKSQIVAYLNMMDFDYIGITATTPQIPLVHRIGEFLKIYFPEIELIIGGPHVTLSYSSLKNGSDRTLKSFEQLLEVFDHVVIGYGELAIIRAFEPNAPQILDAEEDKSLFVTNAVYEKLPPPARHLIDIKSYNYQIDGNNATSIISQLGCPFDCGFCCGRSKTYRQIRTRSIDSVIKEIDYLYRTYKYTGFMFYDDEINANAKVFENLLNELIYYQKNNNIKLAIRGSSRVDLFTEEQGNIMKLAGFKDLLLGFESGSNKILQSMNKHTTVEQNTKAFEAARKSGLKVKALMSLGHPGESYETIGETRNWLNKVRPDETNITIISQFPGSFYFDLSVFDGNKWVYTAPNNELLFSENIDFLTDETFYKSRTGDYVAHVSTPYLTSDELVAHRDTLERFTKTFAH